MCSGAWRRTAAAISLSRSSGGRSMVRISVRWLAMPTRTRLGRRCSENRRLSALPRASGSMTSPSRTAPAGRSMAAARATPRPPSSLATTAMASLCSRCRPHTGLEAFFVRAGLRRVGSMVSSSGEKEREGSASGLRGRPLACSEWFRGLPGARGGAGHDLAAAGVVADRIHGAGAGNRAARGLLDRERAAAARVDGDRVAGRRRAGRAGRQLGDGSRRRDLVLDDLQGAGTTGVDAGAAVVVLVVRVPGLQSRLRGASVSLRLRVLALALLVQERRNGDGGQDPDDQDHDQKLDEREALLAIQAITKGIEHGEVLLQEVV